MYGGKRDNPGDWQNRSRPPKREWDDDNGRSDLKRRRPFEEGRPREYNQYRPGPAWRPTYDYERGYDRGPPRGGFNRDRGRFRDRPDYADSPRSYSGSLEAGELSEGEVAPQRGDGPAPPLPPPAPVHPGELAPRSEDAPPALSSATSAVAPPPPPPPPLAQVAAGVSVAPTSLPTAPAAFITAPAVAAHAPPVAAAAAAAAASRERPATPVPEIQTARTKAAKAAIENAVSALDLHLPAAAGKEILLLDIERLDTGITDLEDAIAATRAAIVTAQSVANMPKARNLVQRLYDVNRAIAAQVHAQHPMEPVAAAAAAARILDPLQLPSVREAVERHASQRGRVMELLAARARAQREHNAEVLSAYRRKMGAWHMRERRREEAAAAAEAAKLRSPSVPQLDSVRRSLRVQQQGEVELQTELKLADREHVIARETYQKQVAPEQPMLPAAELARKFIDHNGRTWNPVAAETEFNLQTPWTRDEVREFMQRFMVAPKNFRRIAAALDTKTVGDVVAFYYRHKHQLRIKDAMRAQLKKRGRARERMDEGGGTRTSRPTLLSRSASSAVAAAVAAAPLGDAFVAPGVAFAGAGIKRDRDDEAVSWTTDEQERFYMGLSRFGRDYAAVSHVVVSKSAAQCKAFDYLLRKRLRGDRPSEEEEAAAAAASAQAAAGAGDAAAAGAAGLDAGSASSHALYASAGSDAGTGAEGGGKSRRPRGLANWSAEERDEFLATFKDHGRNWRVLQERLPGKTVNQIKHYYHVVRDSLQLDTIVPLHGRRTGTAPRGRPVGSTAAAAAAAAVAAGGAPTISTIAAAALAVAQADGTVAAATAGQAGGIAGSLAEPVVRLRRESEGSDSETISVMSDSDGEEVDTAAASTATSTPLTPAAGVSTPVVPAAATLPAGAAAPVAAEGDMFAALSTLARTATAEQQGDDSALAVTASPAAAATEATPVEPTAMTAIVADAAPVQSEPLPLEEAPRDAPSDAMDVSADKPDAAAAAVVPAAQVQRATTAAESIVPPASAVTQHPIVPTDDDMETELPPLAPVAMPAPPQQQQPDSALVAQPTPLREPEQQHAETAMETVSHVPDAQAAVAETVAAPEPAAEASHTPAREPSVEADAVAPAASTATAEAATEPTAVNEPAQIAEQQPTSPVAVAAADQPTTPLVAAPIEPASDSVDHPVAVAATAPTESPVADRMETDAAADTTVTAPSAESDSEQQTASHTEAPTSAEEKAGETVATEETPSATASEPVSASVPADAEVAAASAHEDAMDAAATAAEHAPVADADAAPVQETTAPPEGDVAAPATTQEEEPTQAPAAEEQTASPPAAQQQPDSAAMDMS